PEPQLGKLILSNITPDSFIVSWTTQAGLFAKIVINVSDARSLHESQQLTVPGDTQQAHITGLVENTAYDVSVTGTTWAAMGSPKEIMFSDITDSAATVSWKAPTTQVESFRITYVPMTG
ncbi:hypothetical protein A6R68_24273, partial [Neotoma lepida]